MNKNKKEPLTRFRIRFGEDIPDDAVVRFVEALKAKFEKEGHWLELVPAPPVPSESEDVEAAEPKRVPRFEWVWTSYGGDVLQCLDCGWQDITGEMDTLGHECPPRPAPVPHKDDIPY